MKRHRCRPLTLILLATAGVSASASAQSQGAAPFECRWTDAPPVIDGRGDDAAWKNALPVEKFSQPWAEGKPAAREGTKARLLWDREWIYFLAEMEDSDVSADVREHDGPMWDNDVFEIFLKPSEKHAGYFEFEVNPAEAVLDVFFPTVQSRGDDKQVTRHPFHAEAKVTIRGTLNDHGDRDTGWSVEGRIPWSDFNPAGGRPAPGETWRVNLARVNGKNSPSQLSSAAPLTKPSFHRIEEYVPLRFAGPEMQARTRWENTRLIGSPDGPPKYVTQRAWPRLPARPLVAVAPTPDGKWMWFIEQDAGRDGNGTLRRFKADGDGSDAETVLAPADLAYSIAFHPRFAENGFAYLGTNGPHEKPPRFTRVHRYTVHDGKPDPASDTVIIEWPSDGHNGAGIAFANDGMLFVSSGDGTFDSDLDHVGQDPRSMRAKILRIDVDHPADGKLYSVPRDNPFVGNPDFAPETWAYGLRNPWRLTFDPVSGQLWSGENGNDAYEYARLVRRGENYGWSHYEGSHLFHPDEKLGPQPVTFPTVEHSHSEFRSLSGGIVYRGRLFPELVGAYIYGDWGTGRIWAAKHDGTRLEWHRELCDTPFAITHVTADATGELLIADYGADSGGAIYRLARGDTTKPPPPFPGKLSETQLFTDTAKLAPAPGILPYEICAPGWHDGATAQYHLGLPGNGVIELHASKSWQAPDGTAIAQTLALGGRRIETRVLVKQQNDWAGYSYVWNAEQTDALLAAKTGADIEVKDRQPWRIPSRAECMMCHSRQANFALTLHDAQLNHGDQLTRWERLGLLRADGVGFNRERTGLQKVTRPPAVEGGQRGSPVSPLLPRDPAHLAKFVPANDAQASLETRARSYLGANCAHCHTLYGGGQQRHGIRLAHPPEGNAHARRASAARGPRIDRRARRGSRRGGTQRDHRPRKYARPRTDATDWDEDR
jgi:glucose/arabinose dehydrogenase